MSTPLSLSLLRVIINPSTHYVEEHERVQAEILQGTHVEKEKAWKAYARRMHGHWGAIGRIAAVYAGYVTELPLRLVANDDGLTLHAHRYSCVTGLLSIPGSSSGPITTCIGLMCIVCSIFSVLLCGVYANYMPAEEDTLRGLDWMAVSR